MTKEPKFRKRLNTGQLEVLELLLRFRFGTTDLVAQALGRKNGTVIKSRLGILREQEYIGRHYRGVDRLQGKHAAYYLTAKGARILKDEDTRIIKRAYKDKNASRQFIDHSLSVFVASCRLKDIYGNTLRFFTKTELVDYDYFPKPLPDAFLSLKGESGTTRFFLSIFEASTPAFVLGRQIKQFIDYNANEEWSVTDSDFPNILIICDTAMLQSRIERKIITSLKNANDMDNLVFATTNWHTLTTDGMRAWRIAGDDRPRSLVEL